MIVHKLNLRLSVLLQETARDPCQNPASKTSSRSGRLGRFGGDAGPCAPAPRMAFARRSCRRRRRRRRRDHLPPPPPPAPFPTAEGSRQNQAELTTEDAVDDEIHSAPDGGQKVRDDDGAAADDAQQRVAAHEDLIEGQESVGDHGKHVGGDGHENDDDADRRDRALVGRNAAAAGAGFGVAATVGDTETDDAMPRRPTNGRQKHDVQQSDDGQGNDVHDHGEERHAVDEVVVRIRQQRRVLITEIAKT